MATIQPRAQAGRRCPRCGGAGSRVPPRRSERAMAECRLCCLLYTDREVEPSGPTGIEYLDLYQRICGPWREQARSFGLDVGIEAFAMRSDLCTRYSWAVPTPEAVALVAGFSPVVEVGAGTGYWAMLLRAARAEVDAIDKAPGRNKQAKGTWTDVRAGTPADIPPRRDATLLLCWPPYGDPMSLESLARFRGGRVVYVGEGDGGCTGSHEFHRALKRVYRRTGELDLPQWPGIHDWLTVWEKR